MAAGLVFGFVSAVAIGVGTLLGASGARRIGALPAAVATVLIAYLLMGGYAYTTGSALTFDSPWLLRLLLLGCAVGAWYLLLFRALEIGPVSVVSAITASSGAMTVLFAFLFFGERPTLLQWVAVPVATAGAVLASIAFEPDQGRLRVIGWGPLLAAPVVFLAAIVNAGIRDPIRDAGPIQPILIERTVTVAVLLAALVFTYLRGRERAPKAIPAVGHTHGAVDRLEPSGTASSSGRTVDPALALLLFVLGLVDALAFVTFAEGLVRLPAWLMGLISQSGRVIAVFGGLVVFREHLRRSQWIGVGLVVCGLLLATVG